MPTENALAPVPPTDLLEERNCQSEEMLVYRHATSHEVPVVSLRVQWLVLGGVTAVAMAFVAWTLLRTLPNLAHMGWAGCKRRDWIRREVLIVACKRYAWSKKKPLKPVVSGAFLYMAER